MNTESVLRSIDSWIRDQQRQHMQRQIGSGDIAGAGRTLAKMALVEAAQAERDERMLVLEVQSRLARRPTGRWVIDDLYAEVQR